MKTLKFLTLLFITSFALNSCLVDDEDVADLNDDGKNFVGFKDASASAPLVADGSTKDFYYPVQLGGPTYKDIAGDVSFKISVDPSSTAVNGVHYTLLTNTITLNKSNNFIQNVGIRVLSAAADAPETKVLKLLVTDISDANVISSGRTGNFTVNIVYLCFSNLAGDYASSCQNLVSGFVMNHGVETFTQIGDGTYQTESTGTWAIGSLRPYQGYIFQDFCNAITVEEQNLFDWYSNLVFQTADQEALSFVNETASC